jgi:hypothetical protein
LAGAERIATSAHPARRPTAPARIQPNDRVVPIIDLLMIRGVTLI